MSLIRWQPWRELDTLRQQMDRLFEDLVHTRSELPLMPKLSDGTWAPAIELKETDQAIILKAQLPGMNAEDLDIQVGQDAVAIAGEHREEQQTEESGFFRSEFRYGQFQRIVPLPATVENQQVKAEFKDGLLTLTLPKVAGTARKVVKVDLTMQEKARETVAHQRQHAEHRQQTAHARSMEALETPSSNGVQEAAREGVVEQRQQEEHLQETMHRRSAAEVGTGS